MIITYNKLTYMLGFIAIILLGDGTKKRQQKDIDNAQRHWKDYKERKKKER